MNLYTLLLLCATAISILLGLSVYSLNRKATANRLFMIVMLTNAYWAFCLFMIAQSPNAAEAFFWGKVLSFWPLLNAFMLHFALSFTESEILKNRLFYIVLYLPALLFSLIDLTTDWIYTDPTLKAWGYTNTIQVDSVISSVYGIWSGIFSLIVLFTFGNYYHKVIDKIKKRQTAFIAAGFSMPIVVSLFTDSLFPAVGLNFPVIGPIFGSLTSIFVVYAMIKYELFGFRTEIAVENVFSTMPDSVILVNLKGVIIKVNRSLIALTEYTEVELVGKPVIQMLKRANVVNGEGAIPEIFAQLQKIREIHNYEIIFQTKSGQPKTGTLSCSVVTDNNGHDVGYAFILHDISARKLMEQKLLRAERLVSIGELAGLIGHDLRNPLSGIRGATFYLKRKHKDNLDAEDITMYDSIDKSINYSNKIINDLLEYSSELCLDPVPVGPKVLVQAALDMVDMPENITIIDETSNLPALFVDEAKLQRGFAGIVKNAFDAMPEGGELRIKSGVEGRFIVVTFTDTGVGMTEETLSKLWTPLFTTKAKGMGFGLAICKRIVDAHGGRISAVSVVEQGTTVQVELPLDTGSIAVT
jgi:PAS domain S-box-containing protein